MVLFTLAQEISFPYHLRFVLFPPGLWRKGLAKLKLGVYFLKSFSSSALIRSSLLKPWAVQPWLTSGRLSFKSLRCKLPTLLPTHSGTSYSQNTPNTPTKARSPSCLLLSTGLSLHFWSCGFSWTPVAQGFPRCLQISGDILLLTKFGSPAIMMEQEASFSSKLLWSEHRRMEGKRGTGMFQGLCPWTRSRIEVCMDILWRRRSCASTSICVICCMAPVSGTAFLKSTQN